MNAFERCKRPRSSGIIELPGGGRISISRIKKVSASAASAGVVLTTKAVLYDDPSPPVTSLCRPPTDANIDRGSIRSPPQHPADRISNASNPMQGNEWRTIMFMAWGLAVYSGPVNHLRLGYKYWAFASVSRTFNAKSRRLEVSNDEALAKILIFPLTTGT